MKRMVGWTCKSAYALFVAFALSFGASQAFAATTIVPCTQFAIGSCPPYSNFGCDRDCQDLGYNNGHCFGPCCECML